jgi:plasmid stability protein
MSENVLQTLQTAIQDVIAPDVRELKVRMGAHEKQSETQFESLREMLRSVLLQQEANSKALLAAIGESKAKHELDTYKLIAALSERVTALESARH